MLTGDLEKCVNNQHEDYNDDLQLPEQKRKRQPSRKIDNNDLNNGHPNQLLKNIGNADKVNDDNHKDVEADYTIVSC